MNKLLILASEENGRAIGFYAGDNGDPLWTTHLNEVYEFTDGREAVRTLDRLKEKLPHLTFTMYKQVL